MVEMAFSHLQPHIAEEVKKRKSQQAEQDDCEKHQERKGQLLLYPIGDGSGQAQAHQAGEEEEQQRDAPLPGGDHRHGCMGLLPEDHAGRRVRDAIEDERVGSGRSYGPGSGLRAVAGVSGTTSGTAHGHRFVVRNRFDNRNTR